MVAVLLLGAVATLLLDVRFGDTTCGTGLLARNTSQVLIVSNDPAQDDFDQQQIIDSCGRRLLAVRLFSGGLVILAIAAAVSLWRGDREPTGIPGGPVV